MSLPSGARVGNYEIVALLGAGGMGEVYRARDGKLQREVAIKILPAAFASDPDRLARFEREAQVLASLNHPHIAAIYGFEQSPDGVPALVLELVEGPTLADRIAEGPIPLDEALPIAKQIADALEAAHEAGVIHRDLKPANIKLRPDGTVKVLDFGLAKLNEAGGASGVGGRASLSMSPTITSPALMTGGGVILGTAAYMSPEQARGRPVDKRTDIWAFGCVLFEMLTGTRPFAGVETTDVLVAILSREPDWGALPPSTPLRVRDLLQRCLAKDARERLRDIGDARYELAAAGRAPEDRAVSAGRVSRSAIVAAFLVGALIAAPGGYVWRDRVTRTVTTTPAPSVLAVIELPAEASLALGTEIPAIGFDSTALALSRDGRRLAFVGASPSGSMVFLRDMASDAVRSLAGTEGARYAFFSPDGRWVGYLTDDKLRKVPVDGGAPVTLANAAVPVRAVWTADDTIYFDEGQGTRLSRVSGNGGPVSPVLNQGLDFFFSDVLPGSDRALGTLKRNGMSGDYADVAVVSLASGERTVVLQSAYDARYVPPGFLVFGRSANVHAVRFDAASAQVIGEPIVLVRGAAMDSLFNQVHAAVSDTGMLAYVPGGDRAIGRPAWVDRRGRIEPLDVPPRGYGVMHLSAAGDRLAAHVTDVRDYVWVYDLRRREGRLLAGAGSAGWPVWSPDGSRLALTVWESSLYQSRVVARGLDGGTEEEIAPVNKGWNTAASSWSPDGRTVALDVWGPGFRMGFRTGVGPVQADLTAAVDTWGPDFGPDGKWVAYASAETGRFEIRVRAYPEGNDSRQISTDGGLEPRWCRCGELFFRNGNRWLSTRIRTTPELEWEPPRLVLQTDFIDTPGRSYDVSPDGSRILVVKRAEADMRQRITLVMNWMNVVNRPTQ